MAHFGLTELQSHKIRVRQKAWRATKNGTLVRPGECSNCHNSCKPEEHHPDYSKPLHVIWLCKKCHIHLHAMRGDMVHG